MVIRRKKKFRKFRGQRSYGYGSHKKHRGGGSRGGRGMAGLHKHKWSYTVKYLPEHFGKFGFKRPVKAVKEVRAINLKYLDQLADKLIKEKIAEKEDDKIKIDVSKLGYEKVLGSGKLTQPLIIEAKFFSKQAIKKIEEIGGKVIKHG
jgi:large subunit ribosomal protein L15